MHLAFVYAGVPFSVFCVDASPRRCIYLLKKTEQTKKQPNKPKVLPGVLMKKTL